MDKIFEQAARLSGSIKNSSYYKDYLISKKKINNNTPLKDRIDFYKAKHFEYQTKLLQGENPSFDEEKYVSSLYFSLILNNDAKTFLESEEVLLEIIRTVFDTLTHECEIDLNF